VNKEDVYRALRAIEYLLDSHMQSPDMRKAVKALAICRGCLQRNFRIKVKGKLVEPMHSILRYVDSDVGEGGLIVRPLHKRNYRAWKRRRERERHPKLEDFNVFDAPKR